MIPSPVSGSVSTFRPRKPRCLAKIGPKPCATPTTSILIAGGNRKLVTLAYTTIASFPTLLLPLLLLLEDSSFMPHRKVGTLGGRAASIHRVAEKAPSRKPISMQGYKNRYAPVLLAPGVAD